ncbi:MAG: cytochrome c [Pseudomonadota bacterium]
MRAIEQLRGAVCALLLLLTGAAAASADDAPAGDAANGKRLFLADGCYQCHGTVGQGGRYNGPAPRLARTELPFDGFMGVLRTPPNDMPPYVATVLSDKEAADIYAYLHGLPEPRAVRDIRSSITEAAATIVLANRAAPR